jgi:hypothetical protein
VYNRNLNWSESRRQSSFSAQLATWFTFLKRVSDFLNCWLDLFCAPCSPACSRFRHLLVLSKEPFSVLPTGLVRQSVRMLSTQNLTSFSCSVMPDTCDAIGPRRHTVFCGVSPIPPIPPSEHGIHDRHLTANPYSLDPETMLATQTAVRSLYPPMSLLYPFLLHKICQPNP